AKYLLGLVLIVRPTSQPQILDRRLSPTGHGCDVVEFHAFAGVATTAGRADEGAAPAIAHPDCPFDLHADMTAISALVGACPAPAGQRLGADSETPFLLVLDRNTKRALEHLFHASGRNGVAIEDLQVAEQVVCLFVQGAAEQITNRRAQGGSSR